MTRVSVIPNPSRRGEGSLHSLRSVGMTIENKKGSETEQKIRTCFRRPCDLSRLPPVAKNRFHHIIHDDWHTCQSAFFGQPALMLASPKKFHQRLKLRFFQLKTFLLQHNNLRLQSLSPPFKVFS